jgi:hypothetical protein
MLKRSFGCRKTKNPIFFPFRVGISVWKIDRRFRLHWRLLASMAEKTWSSIATDFHRGGYWGFRLLSKNHPTSKKPPTDEQVQTRDVRRFFWTAIQSLVIMKGIILYFGLNYAIEREAFYGGRDKNFYAWGLGISVLVSFGGLLLFAIRQGNKRVWT